MENKINSTKWSIIAGIMGIVHVLYQIISEIVFIIEIQKHNEDYLPSFTFYVFIVSVLFLCVILFMKKHNFLLLIPFAVFGLLDLYIFFKNTAQGAFFIETIIDFFAGVGICVIGYFALSNKENQLSNIVKKLWFLPASLIALNNIITLIQNFSNGIEFNSIILSYSFGTIPYILMYLFVAKWIVTPLVNEKESSDYVNDFSYNNENETADYYNNRSNDFERENNKGERKMATTLLKSISVPAEQTKKTTIGSNLFYSKIDIYQNKVVGSGKQTMTWFFKNYNGVDFVKANMNSQFAQIVFLTGINSKSRVIGPDFGSVQNLNAMNDTNRILFCSGMFSFGKTNTFAETIYREINNAFTNYQEHAEELEESRGQGAISAADELKKFKELLDMGIISQEEFDAKKKQLLGL